MGQKRPYCSQRSKKRSWQISVKNVLEAVSENEKVASPSIWWYYCAGSGGVQTWPAVAVTGPIFALPAHSVWIKKYHKN